jgi:hypothetical protein
MVPPTIISASARRGRRGVFAALGIWGFLLICVAPHLALRVGIAAGLFAAVLMALRFWWEYDALRRYLRQSQNQCPQCGYDLRASPIQCPECGRSRASR